MGVGGSVDVISGHAKRASVIIRKIGLEWLFRMICKPTRIRENKTIITYAKIVLDERRRIRKQDEDQCARIGIYRSADGHSFCSQRL